MVAQLITYDLRQPGRDYTSLFTEIQSLGNWWHCLESVWIVKTNLSSAQVRDRLARCLDSNDKLLVVKLAGDWATRGLDKDCNDWLQSNL